MTNNLIRDDINYGPIVTGEIKGHRIYFSEHYKDKLPGVTIVEDVGEIKPFHPVRLGVMFNIGYAIVDIYVPEGGNHRDIGAALSLDAEAVFATASARNLAWWYQGELAGEVGKLSDFYSNITEEEDQKHSF